MIMKWSYVLIESLLFKNKNWKDVLQPMNNMVYLVEKPTVNLFAHLLNWNNDSVGQSLWLLKLNSLSYGGQILIHQVPTVFL